MKSTDEIVPTDPEELVTRVRERYGRIAEGASSGACCGETACCSGPSPAAASSGLGYRATDLEAAPEGADMGLGCGAPIVHLDLRPGETVLDLGSGGGLDAFIAADRVGQTGKVIGVDMTPAMIRRAREAAMATGRSWVEFRQGRLEALPVEAGSIDAVTSNCVINLVPDKGAVFGEIARVLRPGGRLVISDVVLDGHLPEALERDLTSWVGCVSGAMQRDAYFERLETAGLGGFEILSDVDFLAAVGEALPEELRALAASTGVRPQDVAGKVRSITYRAVKP